MVGVLTSCKCLKNQRISTNNLMPLNKKDDNALENGLQKIAVAQSPGIQTFAKEFVEEALKDLFRLGDERCGGDLLQEYVRRCESMQTSGVYWHSQGKAGMVSSP